MLKEFEYSIDCDHSSIREFLLKKEYSKNCLSFLKQNEGVFLNGKPVKMTEPLYAGDILKTVFDERQSNEMVVDTEIPVDMVYEDEDIIVVNKQAGLPVHPSFFNYTHNLANALSHYYHSRNENYINRCITRLDGDTSGLVLLAKNLYSCAILQKRLRQHKIYKEYTAIVEGNFAEDRGIIDKPIARKAPDTMERCVRDDGQPAVTEYHVIRQISGYSMLRIITLTGRTHQIRVHMAYIGHPLIGDWLYNPKSKIVPRQALHVSLLEFAHPITGEHMSFSCELPEEIRIEGL
ncbi:MAG: RluA family pseudouridine synthase [Erysipelotrichaceae bacterium]|nr:RluA family pseudouridine synthase [Erysipelotrichaceae bacterium]